MLGAHYDGWTYGTSDDTSGWTTMMEVGRSLGRLLDRGWRPDRTIVIAGWDGEEYGLFGSTEWAEQFQRDLVKRRRRLREPRRRRRHRASAPPACRSSTTRSSRRRRR